MARLEQFRIAQEVAWEGFVQWIKANHEGVLAKAGAHLVPVSQELFLDTLFVSVQCLECNDGVGSRVVLVEIDSLAVGDQGVTVRVVLEAEGGYLLAQAYFFVDVLQHGIDPLADADWVTSDHVLSVEVRETFATD